MINEEHAPTACVRSFCPPPPVSPCTPFAAVVSQLGPTCPDALMALRQLRSGGALVLGATRRPVELPADALGGPDRLLAVPGLVPGEAGGAESTARQLSHNESACLPAAMSVLTGQERRGRHVTTGMALPLRM